MIRSLTDWILDQVVAVTHPVTHRIAGDLARQLQIEAVTHVTITTKDLR